MDVPHSSDVPHVAISNPTPLPFTDHRRTGTKSALPVQFSRFLTGNLLEWAQGGVLGRRCENLISCTRGSNPDRRRHQRLHRTANTAGPSPHPHRRKPILAVSPDASRPPLTPPPQADPTVVVAVSGSLPSGPRVGPSGWKPGLLPLVAGVVSGRCCWTTGRGAVRSRPSGRGAVRSRPNALRGRLLVVDYPDRAVTDEFVPISATALARNGVCETHYNHTSVTAAT